jgi:hypothetical protein
VSVKVSVQATATVEDVWQTLIDVATWPEWTATMTTVERLDSGPFVVGSQARIKQPRLPAAVWTVTELRENEQFTWMTKSTGFTLLADHVVRDAGNGVVDIELSVTQHGFIGVVLEPFTRKMARKNVEIEAYGLKERSELHRSS